MSREYADIGMLSIVVWVLQQNFMVLDYAVYVPILGKTHKSYIVTGLPKSEIK
jgi:hypothetical protein